MRILLLVLTFIVGSLAHADITGLWKTVDEDSGQPQSIVEIQPRGGEYVGTIRNLLSKPDETLCEKCTGPLKGQPIVGMEIITGMREDGAEYAHGKILDPSSGKIYRGKLWLEDEQTLKVRGYLGLFFRTQTWQRVTE